MVGADLTCPNAGRSISAGIGGIRLAFQQAFMKEIEFVFSSEIH